MSQVFEGYERQYCEISANLTRKCASAGFLNGAEMGITGELVRNVFSKSRSTKTPEINIKGNNSVEKKRWKTSVKSYLCGDDLFDSVLAEEDSASVKSSEAHTTLTESEYDAHSTTEGTQSQEGFTNHENSDRDHSSSCSKFLDEDAAVTMIQSAFRGYKARCLMRDFTSFRNEFGEGKQSPSRESLATSIEVQTGNSIISIQEDPSVSNKPQQKPKPSTFKPKEDWDDSTLDSTRAKMRIQNRLEAMTRRERALAYAFSQQLRICSKKQQPKSDGKEPNMGWSWLERWMATRQTEVSPVDDHTSKPQLINNEAETTMFKTRPSLKKNFLDLSFEEKESCGSNEVPVQNEINSATPLKEDTDGCKLAKNRLKAPRSISRRKTVPTYQYQKEQTKVTKKDGSQELVKDRRQKTKHSRSRSVCKDDASYWLPTDHSVSG